MNKETKNILKKYGCDTQKARQSKSLEELTSIMQELVELRDETWQAANLKFEETGEWDDSFLESVIDATKCMYLGMRRAKERWQTHQAAVRLRGASVTLH